MLANHVRITLPKFFPACVKLFMSNDAGKFGVVSDNKMVLEEWQKFWHIVTTWRIRWTDLCDSGDAGCCYSYWTFRGQIIGRY